MRESIDSRRISDAALALLDRDKNFDDSVYTPLGAIGLAVEVGYDDGPDDSNVPAVPVDQPPHLPGAAALEAPIEA